MSALVEKKTGFDGSRTLIQGGFCAWCRAGSIFAQDIVGEGSTKDLSLPRRVGKSPTRCDAGTLPMDRLKTKLLPVNDAPTSPSPAIAPAARARQNYSPVIWLNLFCLDAPLVALAWQWLFARSFGAHLTWPLRAAAFSNRVADLSRRPFCRFDAAARGASALGSSSVLPGSHGRLVDRDRGHFHRRCRARAAHARSADAAARRDARRPFARFIFFSINC